MSNLLTLEETIAKVTDASMRGQEAEARAAILELFRSAQPNRKHSSDEDNCPIEYREGWNDAIDQLNENMEKLK